MASVQGSVFPIFIFVIVIIFFIFVSKEDPNKQLGTISKLRFEWIQRRRAHLQLCSEFELESLLQTRKEARKHEIC